MVLLAMTYSSLLAAASKAELQDAFITGSAYLLAAFAGIVFFGVVMAHIFRD